MTTPKAFISYSWSSPTHEQWVLDLANDLMESGVEIILDKWDLKEGHDAVAFMETMVTDPEIEKVIIISDIKYANKADGRAGGVGTETQIISKEVYNDQKQDKFVAVVSEKNDDGTHCLPTYYKSRIFIDLSEPDTYTENFEKLLRWIFNKPLHVKPSIGKKPSFLDKQDSISLQTTLAYKRTIAAIKENKPYLSGALDEYFSLFSTNLEKFRITEFEGEFDEEIIENIDNFLPYRKEVISLFYTIAQYAPTEENITKLHRFFENLLPYLDRPEHVTSYSESSFDNFKFIVHELFLYAVAILLKLEAFKQANMLIGQRYYWDKNPDRTINGMTQYYAFRNYLPSLSHRNDRLKLNRLSLHSDLLEKRSKQSGLEFRYLMQADFLLFMRAELNNDNHSGWYPDTLLYLDNSHCAFEMFARSTSKSYFDKVKCLLNISKPSDLNSTMEAFKSDRRNIPRWHIHSFNPSVLISFENLATHT